MFSTTLIFSVMWFALSVLDGLQNCCEKCMFTKGFLAVS